MIRESQGNAAFIHVCDLHRTNQYPDEAALSCQPRMAFVHSQLFVQVLRGVRRVNETTRSNWDGYAVQSLELDLLYP